MHDDVKNTLYPQILSRQDEWIKDSVTADLNKTIDDLALQWAALDSTIKAVTYSFTSEVNEVNQRRFDNAVKQAVGIDVGSMVNREGIADVLENAAAENSRLVVNVTREMENEIRRVVHQEVINGSTGQAMIKQLNFVPKTYRNRAKVIARDQTSKLTATLAETRASNLGIKQYVWRTSKDERVRDDHRDMEGVVCTIGKPTREKDGLHVGQAIQCRCHAEWILPDA